MGLKANSIQSNTGGGISIKAVSSVDELRATTTEQCITNGMMIMIIAGVMSIWEWDDARTDADNGTSVIKPTIITTGRWIKAVSDSVPTPTETEKWNVMPIGTCQPFVPSVMGSDIATWLAAHPKWDKLDNTIIAGIEGRAMAVASDTHAAGTQFGSDNAELINFSSSTGDTIIQYVGGGGNYLYNNSTVVDKNIQRTQYLDWIVKVA